MLDKCPNTVRSQIKKCPKLIQVHKDERVRWASTFMRCDWEMWREEVQSRRF
uniref:RNA-directed DNA polymerase (Reverse transcriptase) n=1 Tax=Heterorhabditis bacteriophora TaxID=37862 RepID=A0A1I7WE87_HETBA